jgi:hypothetical protein
MNHEFFSNRIEFVFDDLDTNAISFYADDGYFSIQTGVCLESEENDRTANEPYFELSDQENSQAGRIEEIVFDENKITLVFKTSDLFMEKYRTLTIKLASPTTKETVDFFNNCLFLGKYITYSPAFPVDKRVIQTKFKIDYGD